MTDLHWLAATLGMTALFWLPYVLQRITQHGLIGAMGNPSPDNPKPADWAIRAKAAHANAVENLAIFAPLLLIANAMHLSGAATLMLAKLFFFARLAHFIVYTLGIPVVRTLTFAAGWIAIMGVAMITLGVFG